MKKLELTAGTMIAVVVIAMGAIYLFDQFTTGTLAGKDLQFEIPPGGIESPIFWIIRLAILGGFTTLALGVVAKFTKGSLSKKDIVTYIVLGVVVWLLWDKLLYQFFGPDAITSLSDLSLKFAKAARLIP